MTLFLHELRRARLAFAVWTGVVAFMILICVLLYPQFAAQMGEVTNLFSSMGAFTKAFGMDRLDFGSIMGFYGIECGNILGMGGAFFAALTGALMIAREENARTAEFLLSHPVNRASVLGAKLAACLTEIALFNLISCAVALLSFALIGERADMPKFWLFHLATFAMHAQIACLCFALSAVMGRGASGAGIGVAAALYFLNIIGNVASGARFLDYVTPFAYADAASIMTDAAVEWPLLYLGAGYALAAVAFAFVYYKGKVIAA